jgi:hypothetical protein
MQAPQPPQREGKQAVRVSKRTLDLSTPPPEPEGGPSEPLVPRPSALARMQMRIGRQLPPVPVYAPEPPADLKPLGNLSIKDIEEDPTEY